MRDFPRTYQISRHGVFRAITIHDEKSLLAFRTEMELLTRFGKGATFSVLNALKTTLARIRPKQQKRRAAPIAKMMGILQDAQDPINTATATRIDNDFPDIKGKIDMDSTQRASKAFHEEVAAEIEASEVEHSKETAEVFREADSGKEIDTLDTSHVLSDEDAAAAVEAMLAEVEATTDPDAESDDLSDDEIAAAVVANAERGSPNGTPVPSTANPLLDEQDVERPVDDLDLIEDTSTEFNEDALEEILSEAHETEIPTGDDALEAILAEQGAEAALDTIEAETDRADETPDAAAKQDTEITGHPVTPPDTDDSQDTDTFPSQPGSHIEPEQGTTAEADISAIASAFEQATAELGQITDEINASVGNCEAGTSSPEMNASTRSVLETPCQPRRSSAAELRSEVQAIKNGMQAAFDRVAAMLDRIDETYRQAENRLARADAFQQAAMQARQASQMFTDAQAEAAKARTVYEQAEIRLHTARDQWESAQQAATQAAEAVT